MMKKNRFFSIFCAGAMLFASVLPQIPYDVLNVSAAYDDIYTYGNFEYKDMYGSIYITAYTGTNRSVTIPNTINVKKVTYFYADVFAGNEEIESITIPANIDVIPDGAFYGCTSLKQFNSHNSRYSFSNGFLYYIRPCTSPQLQFSALLESCAIARQTAMLCLYQPAYVQRVASSSL